MQMKYRGKTREILEQKGAVRMAVLNAINTSTSRDVDDMGACELNERGLTGRVYKVGEGVFVAAHDCEHQNFHRLFAV